VTEAKARLFEEARRALGEDRPAVAWSVPGRIEFLGKHTDYAGGRSLLCAVEQGFCVVARPVAEPVVTVTSAATGERASFPLSADLTPRPGHWTNYPMTVAARVAANFPGGLRGADVAFASDLPQAAGLSSSSALVVATFLALSDINGLPQRDEYRQSIDSDDDLCAYLGTIENGQTFGRLVGQRGVGTFGGSEDHTALLRSSPGALVRYGFKPAVREGVVPLPADHVFVIAASGVVAEKTRAAKEKYNRVSLAASALLSQWNGAAPAPADSLAAAVRSAPDAAERLRSMLKGTDTFDRQTLLDRLDVFVAESERIIPATAAALADGRLDEVGRLVDESQANANRMLGNQVAETAFLAASARRRGAVAASAFGAGFGGSVWALVPTAAVAAFTADWSAAYGAAFPQAAAAARFFQTRAGPAAARVLG
jgi:galactokinase